MNKDLIKCCATVLVVILLALVLITACSGCAQTTPGFEELDGFIDNPVEWVKTNNPDEYDELRDEGFCVVPYGEFPEELDVRRTPYTYALYDLGESDGYYGYYGLYVYKRSFVQNDDGTIDTVYDKCFSGVYDGDTVYGRYYDVEEDFTWEGMNLNYTALEDATFGSGKDTPDDVLRMWYYYFENH